MRSQWDADLLWHLPGHGLQRKQSGCLPDNSQKSNIIHAFSLLRLQDMCGYWRAYAVRLASA